MSTEKSGEGVPPEAGANQLPRLLEKSEHLVLALLESASQAIISMDRRGSIVLVNRRAEEMFGYTREELLGARIEMLLPEAGALAAIRGSARITSRGRASAPWASAWTWRAGARMAASFPVEVSLSYIETEEGQFGIAFVSDISQRKLLEEQLLHAQKMEAVGRLAGGVAHDFNNMLTVISGYNRMILDDLSPLDPLRGNAEEILKAADRAAALTNQLLAFSRRQIMRPARPQCEYGAGEHPEDAATADRRRHPTGPQAGIGFGQHQGRSQPHRAGHRQPGGECARCHADRRPPDDRERQCRVWTRPIPGRIRAFIPGEFVMIAVSDTGHGMDAETRRRIFEPFFTTKERGKGTGLGLATVYGMVKQSGGDIWVYSELGKGTTFKLYFPQVDEAAAETIGRRETSSANRWARDRPGGGRREGGARTDGEDPAAVGLHGAAGGQRRRGLGDQQGSHRPHRPAC